MSTHTTSSTTAIGPDSDKAWTTIRFLGPYKVEGNGSASPTLWLSPMEHSDLGELVRILNLSPSISQGLSSSDMTFPFPASMGERLIEQCIRRSQDTGINTTFAIRLYNPISAMIGLVSLTPLEDHKREGLCVADPLTHQVENLLSRPLETTNTDTKEENETLQRERATQEGKVILRCGILSYWMSDEHRGKGYMTHVVRFLLEHLATKSPEKGGYGFDRIHADGWSDNTGSLRVMAKAGMKFNPVNRTIFVPKFNESRKCTEYVWHVWD